MKRKRPLAAAKADSAVVNTAPEEVVRLRKIQSISRFFRSGIWEGDLSQMREDQPPHAAADDLNRHSHVFCQLAATLRALQSAQA
jgi:hypothetical protein